MRKKGFTLVELLAVIVILSIIMAIAVTNFSGVKNNTDEELLEIKIKDLEASAIIYGQENPEELKDSCEVSGDSYKYCKVITVGELLDKDYMESSEGLEKINGVNKKILKNNVNGRIMRCDTVQIYRKNNRMYAKMLNVYSNDSECTESDNWTCTCN